MAQRYSHPPFERNYYRRFYLVQGIYHSPTERYEKMGFTGNPFGYGRLGDYELSYMGSAEFEHGVIPDSLKRFAKAQDENKIMRGEMTWDNPNNDQKLMFMYIEEDGTPNDPFIEWVVDQHCDGKEPARRFYQQLTEPEQYATDMERFSSLRQDVVWWSLLDDIMFSFVDEDGTSHLEKMIESMSEGTNRVRGA